VPKPQSGKVRAARQKAFLEAYRRTASVTLAARAARVHRSIHYLWMLEPKYAADFGAAQAEAADLLEDEAIRRAHQGLAKPIVYQGSFQYRRRLKKGTGPKNHKRAEYEEYGPPLAIQEYSDQLLMFLLKGFKPTKYKERGALEVSGPDGSPIAVDSGDPRLKELTDAELEQLVVIAKKLTPAGVDAI
jgi:hypothetical protein